MSNEWAFEHSVRIGRLHVETFFFQGAPEKVSLLRKRINAARAALSLSKDEVMRKILETGLSQVEDEITGKPDKLPKPGTSAYTDWVIAEECRNVAQKRQDFLMLSRLAEDRGVTALAAWAADKHIDISDFLAEYPGLARKVKTQADRDRDFLLKHLRGQGQVAVSCLQKTALEQSLIADVDKEWGRMEKAAERLGVLKDYGLWSLPSMDDVE
jgi:hypothetical protein